MSESKQAQAAPKAKYPAPGISDDTRFFWDGLRQGKLLIQRCAACGTLRHPPGPVCAGCHSFGWDTLESRGQGSVYSFTVMHYPEVPPFEYPNPVVLVQLDEGTRLVAQLVGAQAGQLRIGLRVQADVTRVETSDGGDIALVQFRPA